MILITDRFCFINQNFLKDYRLIIDHSIVFLMIKFFILIYFEITYSILFITSIIMDFLKLILRFVFYLNY